MADFEAINYASRCDGLRYVLMEINGVAFHKCLIHVGSQVHVFSMQDEVMNRFLPNLMKMIDQRLLVGLTIRVQGKIMANVQSQT